MSGSTRLIPCLVIGALVVACQRKIETPEPAGPVAHAASAVAQDPAPASVAAVAVGSVALPLQIRFEIGTAPVAGHPATMELTVTASQPLPRVELEAGSATLELDADTARHALEELEPGMPRQLALRFTPRAAGLADVEIDVRVPADGNPLQSRYAIPVLALEAAATE